MEASAVTTAEFGVRTIQDIILDKTIASSKDLCLVWFYQHVLYCALFFWHHHKCRKLFENASNTRTTSFDENEGTIFHDIHAGWHTCSFFFSCTKLFGTNVWRWSSHLKGVQRQLASEIAWSNTIGLLALRHFESSSISSWSPDIYPSTETKNDWRVWTVFSGWIQQCSWWFDTSYRENDGGARTALWTLVVKFSLLWETLAVKLEIFLFCPVYSQKMVHFSFFHLKTQIHWPNFRLRRALWFCRQ